MKHSLNIFLVGLLGDVPESNEADLNYLMSILLDKVTFLPFGYLMDLYRWDLFDGTVKKEKYQEHWDKLRLEMQVKKHTFQKKLRNFVLK